MSNIERKIESYQKSMQRFGPGIKALQWKNYSSAAHRYINLTSNIKFKEDVSILDIGCGFGDIIPYIFSKITSFSYTGIDVVPEFIEGASIRYPEFEFIQGDYRDMKLDRRFDIVITSGTLNSRNFENEEDIINFRLRTIRDMYEYCTSTLAFNMAGRIDSNKELNNNSKRIYYAEPLIMLERCSKISNKISFITGYSPKDFTIILNK